MIKQHLARAYKSISVVVPSADRAPFFKSLMIHPDRDLVFVRVPKAGCSTVIARLIDMPPEASENTRRLHARNSLVTFDNTKFVVRLRQLSEDDTTLFAVVRNPLTRVLSAFREKIELQIDGPRYRQEFGIALDALVSFEEFVDLLVQRDPLTLDMHFMPQSLILRPDLVRYKHLFHLETGMTECLRWLDDYLNHSGVGAEAFVAPHATNASSLAKSVYSTKILEIVAQYYADDFKYFGYAPDLEDLSPRLALQMPGNTAVRALSMGAFNTVDSQLRGLMPMLLHRH
jgi:hypothetical protein